MITLTMNAEKPGPGSELPEKVAHRSARVNNIRRNRGMSKNAGKDGHKRQVCCTQPRKVAAITLADRVASEMDVKLGERVGSVVRFSSAVSGHTVRKYLADGVLVKELENDPHPPPVRCGCG